MCILGRHRLTRICGSLVLKKGADGEDGSFGEALQRLEMTMGEFPKGAKSLALSICVTKSVGLW